MSTATSSVPSTTGSAGTSASRWAKANDQSAGSAFSGLTRGGKPRGTGRGRGGRGSRGGTSQDTKSNHGEANPEKKAPAKVVAPPSPSLSAKTPGKSNETSTRPKQPSRRPSRANSTTNSTSFNPVTESTGSTTSTRSQNRRRRSQAGKGPPNGLAQIRVPAKDDSTLRPRRQSNVAVPLTAPIGSIKDISSPAIDVKHDVDAFVERVRAAAMAEHRPSTPGSHIDWAGDDDDSLPDLDDWGIPSASHLKEAKKTDLMSPLVVDGLTSLPAVEVPPTIEEGSNQLEVKPMLNGSIPIPQLQISAPTDNSKENTAPLAAGGRSPKPPFSKGSPSPRNSTFPNNRRDPTRKPPRKSPLSTPTIEPQTKPTAISGSDSLGPDLLEGTPKAVDKAPPEEEEEGGLAQSIHAPSAEERLRAANLPPKPVDGRSDSIHASDTLLDSISAPANISAHPTKPNKPRSHARAHTTGRPFRGESSGRGHRGHGSPRMPRNELASGSHHNRTRSNPPAGAGQKNQQHMHRERPVLTGDALTRLARTINGSTSTSPNKTPISTVQD